MDDGELVRTYLTWSVFPEGDMWVAQVIVSINGHVFSRRFPTKAEAEATVATLRAEVMAAHNARVERN